MALLLLSLMLPGAVMAAPPAPGNLAASVAAGPVVNLTWTDVAGEVGYRVERAVAPSTTFTNITGLGIPANSVSFPDTTVVAGVTYSYRVIAFDGTATPDSPPSNTVTITATVPAAPSGLTLSQQAGPPQTVTLTWTGSANAIGYKIERATDAGFTNIVQNVVAASTTQFVDAAILPGATYFYRVSALSALGASAATAASSITVTVAAGMSVGPVVPIAGFPTPNGYPLYYQDVVGTRISLLPIGPENAFDPPNPANPYSAAVGFGAEAFYWMANAQTPVSGALVEFAIEAVWTTPNEAASPGSETVMNRIRIRMGAVQGDGDYSIETPYGTLDFPGVVVDPVSPGREINFTQDLLGVGQDFVSAITPIPGFSIVDIFLVPTSNPAGPWVATTGTVQPVPGRSTAVTIRGPLGVIETTSTYEIFGRRLSAAVTPSFTASAASGTAPLAVNFTDTTTGTPTTWAWDFGDGTISTVQNPAKTFNAAGNFIVKLTASNAGGTATTSQMVSVFAPPVASFTPAAGATATTINFTGSATGNPTGWLWNFGDGSANSTEQSPSHAYAAPGEFTVSLTAINPAGSNTATQTISVGPPTGPANLANTNINLAAGTAAFRWTDNSGTEAGFVLEKATANTFATILQSFQVGASAGTGANVTFTETGFTDGNFFYRVVAVNALGQRSTAAGPITVNAALPTAPTTLVATLLADTNAAQAGNQPGVRLNWVNTATNAIAVHIERSATPDFAAAFHLAELLSPTAIVFTDDSVVLGNTYSYRVHGLSAGGMGPNSNVVTVIVNVPAAPTGLTAGAASQTSINLNWTASAGATGYTVERSIGNGNVTFTQIGTTTGGVTFTDSTVSVGNVYNYRVFATNILGPSATASATATTNMLAPETPALSPAQAQAAGPVVLTWNNVADELGYRIERSSDGGATFTQIVEVGADVATYTDTAAAPATAYQYRVTAFNGLGTGASNTVTVTSATPNAAPAAPTGLTAAPLTFNQVKLDWTDAATNEAGYRVERAIAASGNYTVIAASLPLNTITYTDSAAAASTSYDYRVVAFNVAGDGAAGPVTATTLGQPTVGGGGGAAAETFFSGTSAEVQLPTNSFGAVSSLVEIKSEDNSIKLAAESGSRMFKADGN
ncbi:MAG: PKD domain-containing protein, partial [Chloroflexi bacterium]|nr:PKD domain-containing protein [Chloroflexota bacterium]